MIKIGKFIIILNMIFWVIYNTYFGWNRTPLNFYELKSEVGWNDFVSLIDTIKAVGPVFASMLEDFMAQSTDLNAALRVNAQVTPQGRYTERAPRTPKATPASAAALPAVK
jgi:hypothetical protein